MHLRNKIIVIVCAAALTTFAAPTVRLVCDNPYPRAGATVCVAVLIDSVTDLDSYTYVIVYDTAALRVTGTVIGDPLRGSPNLLAAGGGEVLPIVQNKNAMVSISATRAGGDPLGMVNGCIGIIIFTVKTTFATDLRLIDVELLDSQHAAIAPISAISTTLNKGAD